mmetsp:Transcript_6859/g.22042  ORF Transcript_6859/g.22042 Transcript_6859/m.22042 type:complete len:87 (-) Transcript_6859:471-731(-)
MRTLTEESCGGRWPERVPEISQGRKIQGQTMASLGSAAERSEGAKSPTLRTASASIFREPALGRPENFATLQQLLQRQGNHHSPGG